MDVARGGAGGPWVQAGANGADQSGVAKAQDEMMHGEAICLWCAASVTPRRGGSPKKFCSAQCRLEFHICARRWAEAAVAAGALSIDVLKNGSFTACTLLPGANSPARVGEEAAQSPAPATPRAKSGDARQSDFERRLARTIAARRR